ncbi:AAA family ATPase [Oceanimonas sp. CHS3-5]|uniref:AAA family ATPase n=1 Tax=Oceanimonas sp. CHS3-5 TaxID=3068186 RepID=UPI00273F891A|nr:AAA family ATPase [Oceanimonas sp. CHS3-5]MDP5293550.1 AAA family ATPase [Oceanimonas sp. CHS3-5]
MYDQYGDSVRFSISKEDISENPEAEQVYLDIEKLISLWEEDRKINEKESEKLRSEEVSSKAVLWDLDNEIEVSSSDIGVGFSQLFPLVVASIERNKGIIAGEQPELHVHPRVQVGIGDLLTQNRRKTTYLIETHSEHIILRILKRIRQTTDNELPGNIKPVYPSDISIIYMEPATYGVKAKRIDIDEDGEFKQRWPNGFFSERREELL